LQRGFVHRTWKPARAAGSVRLDHVSALPRTGRSPGSRRAPATGSIAGVPTAVAMWSGPLSLVTRSAHRLRSAAAPRRSVFPMRFYRLDAAADLERGPEPFLRLRPRDEGPGPRAFPRAGPPAARMKPPARSSGRGSPRAGSRSGGVVPDDRAPAGAPRHFLPSSSDTERRSPRPAGGTPAALITCRRGGRGCTGATG
jgi:hypothetical protein